MKYSLDLQYFGGRGSNAGGKATTYSYLKNSYPTGTHRDIYYGSYLTVNEFNGKPTIMIETTGANSPRMLRRGEWWEYQIGSTTQYIPVGDPRVTNNGTTRKGQYKLVGLTSDDMATLNETGGKKPTGKLTWGRRQGLEK